MSVVRPFLPYRVSWAPALAAKKAADARGMVVGDGTSYWDWIEEDEITLTKPRSTFDGAVEVAREKLPLDVAGQVRIARWQTIKEDGQDRHVEDAVWHLTELDEVLSEDNPDHEPEFD